MRYRSFVGAGAVCSLVGLAGMLLNSPRARAQSPTETAQIQQGLAIAPVKLNMAGKDPNLVGYGSYLVNAVGDCNGCHSAGPATEFASGGNPYQGQHPTKINTATYLGGGRDFGAFPSATANFAHIISRNLTPDASGMSAGNTYDQFVKIIRTGVDPDYVHPTCTGAPDGKCIGAPFDGTLLQVMRWPFFSNMTDHELQAIYAYLSSIPCLEGGPGEPPNRCGTTGPKTAAVAGPKTVTVTTSRQLQLDASKSTSADGKALTYFWTMAQGSPSASISGGTTATPIVEFTITRGPYTFLLTVTDSTGKSATDTVTIDFEGN